MYGYKSDSRCISESLLNCSKVLAAVTGLLVADSELPEWCLKTTLLVTVMKMVTMHLIIGCLGPRGASLEADGMYPKMVSFITKIFIHLHL